MNTQNKFVNLKKKEERKYVRINLKELAIKNTMAKNSVGWSINERFLFTFNKPKVSLVRFYLLVHSSLFIFLKFANCSFWTE